MSASRPLKIVLVEDNSADVQLIQQALRQRGIDFEISRFEMAEEALRALLPGPGVPFEPPDLLLVDVHLPGVDGSAVLEAVRAAPAMSDVPVVVLSGSLRERLSEADLAGARGFIHKSMDVNVYMRAIGEMVERLCAGRVEAR